MRLGIRSRLFLSYLALVLLVLGASGFFLANRLLRTMHRQIANELLAHARQVRWELESGNLPAGEKALQEAVVSLARSAAVRITVIAEEGTVLADSELSSEQVHRLENHGQRPEVLQAMRQGQGAAIRYSTTVTADMLYVAVACSDRRQCGTVRVARSLQAVDDEFKLMLRDLALTLAGGVALALLLGLLATALAVAPLRRLVQEARLVLAGRPGKGRSDALPEDLGGIGRSFRRLAEEMETLVQELGRQRDLFLAVLESMHDGVLVVDRDMNITHANQATGRILGNAEVAAGKALVELVRAPDLHRLVKEALEGREGEREFELSVPARRVLAHAAPLKNSPGAVVVIGDVTELRRLETVRRDFVANVAHELRTPLSVVRANVETLLSGYLDKPAQAREFAEAAQRSVERLSRLVEDLLDLSRLESGSFRPELKPVRVVEVAAQVVDTLRPAAGKKGMELSLQIPPRLEVASWPEGLEQVLFNLVDNAVKYGGQGGRVQIVARQQQKCARIEVRDDGPGIEPQHRERLFERFYRVDKGRSRELGGTGLGLAIVKHLVENMGGRVGVDANQPGGSVFWVELEARSEGKDG